MFSFLSTRSPSFDFDDEAPMVTEGSSALASTPCQEQNVELGAEDNRQPDVDQKEFDSSSLESPSKSREY